MEIKVKAPAKINLTLEVLGKRPDGYHNISTVMQAVDLYDVITITDNDSGKVTISCNYEGVPCDDSNICAKAAYRFFDYCKMDVRGVHIDINKTIPTQAGLAGGSSDGAAVIMGLNAMFSAMLKSDEMRAIGEKVGADVPFFLYEKSVMLGTGTGAELTDCGEPGFEMYGVFVTYGEKPSTGAAYRMLDEVKGEDTALKSADKLIKAMQGDDFFSFAGEIVNDFELCCATFSEVSGTLLELGCAGAFLSGSGPTVCGICKTQREAELVSQTVKYPSFVAKLGV